MSVAPEPTTLGSLRAAGYRARTVREELRENLLARMRAGEPIFSGVIGYDETVVPAVENALLCGHDLIFLGERGQAKTRMIRQLTSLFDEWIPEVAGSEIHDDPTAPVSARAHWSPNTATRRRSRGCTATTAMSRSSPHPTCRSPT